LVEHLDEINDRTSLPHAMVEPNIFGEIDLERWRSLIGAKRTHVPKIVSANAGRFVAKSAKKFNERDLLGLVAVHIEERKKDILARKKYLAPLPCWGRIITLEC
jgi:hypothetical protein